MKHFILLKKKTELLCKMKLSNFLSRTKPLLFYVIFFSSSFIFATVINVCRWKRYPSLKSDVYADRLLVLFHLVLLQDQLKMCMCVKTPNHSLNITFSIRKLQSGRFLLCNLFSDKVFLTIVNLMNYFIDISYSKTWCLNMTTLLLLLIFIKFQGNFV